IPGLPSSFAAMQAPQSLPGTAPPLNACAGGSSIGTGKITQGTVRINRGDIMRFTAVFAALAFVPLAAGQAAAQDAAAGEKVFAKCKACHVADEDKNKIGPSLMGVVGRTAGTHEGFKYSKAMIEAGEGGLAWDEATLTSYLRDP